MKGIRDKDFAVVGRSIKLKSMNMNIFLLIANCLRVRVRLSESEKEQSGLQDYVTTPGLSLSLSLKVGLVVMVIYENI